MNNIGEGIYVQIVGDADSFVKETKRADQASDSLGKSLSSNDLNSFTKSLDAATAAMSEMTKELVQNTKSLTVNTKAIEDVSTKTRRIPKSASDASKSISEIGVSSNKTGQIVTNFGRVLSDLPYGFIAIQNNIDPLVASLGLGSGIALAFTVAGAAAVTLVQKYGSLSNAFKEITGLATEATRAQDRYNEIAKKAGESAGAQIAKLEILRSILLDISLSDKERGKALDEYNKIADQSNQISTKQINNISEINRLINAQIKLIGERALAQAAENKLGEAADKFLEAQIRTRPILDKYTNALLDQANASYEAAKASKTIKPIDADQFQEFLKKNPSLAKKFKDDFNELANIRNSSEYKNAEKELQEAQAEFQKQLGQLTPFLSVDSITTKDSSEKAKKDIKTVSDILKQLEVDIGNTNREWNNSGETLKKLADNQLKDYERALRSLIDIGVSPDSKLFQNLQGKADELKAFGRNSIKIKVPVNIDPIPTVQSNNLIKSFDPITKEYKTAFQKGVDSFNPNLDKFSFKLNAQLQQVQSAGFADIGASLAAAAGDIISGNKTLGSALSSVVSTMAGFIINFGKTLIAAGTATLAAKVLVKNPFTAIAAGLIAVAAGTAVQGAINKAPSFAQGGGIVGGPQLAVIGDNPGHEEYVIPSEIMDKIGSGYDGQHVQLVMRGNDLYAITQRSARIEKRVN